MTTSYNTIKVFTIDDSFEDTVNNFLKEHKHTMAEDYYFHVFEHLHIAIIFYYDTNFNKQ